jgi:hypothetical protein
MRPDYPAIHIIVGSGRCGTGYLASQLRTSMDICFPNEPKFVVPLYRQLHRFGSLEQPANLRRLVERVHSCLRRARVPSDPEQILERIREPTYTGVLYAAFQMVADKRGYSRLGYKDPFDVTHLPFLAQLFPTARFIHIIRDGRDVALSLKKLAWGPTNLYGGARYWAWGVSTCRKDGANLGSRYFEVRLVDLMLNTDESAGNL